MGSQKKPLSEKQKKHLRGLAHALRPLLRLGSAGITDAFIAELDSSLAHHELLKLKVTAPDRAERDTAVAAIVERTGAELVTRIGNIAVLYRPRADGPRVELPDG
jgi:RNA-binding protein